MDNYETKIGLSAARTKCQIEFKVFFTFLYVFGTQLFTNL